MKIALGTIERAMKGYQAPVQVTGIGPRDGSIVVGLGVGTTQYVQTGSRFDAWNTTTKEQWGILEAMEVEADSCVCRVFDRINVEFWDELEERMTKDPSPPSGVTFSRQVPEGLIASVQQILRHWGT